LVVDARELLRDGDPRAALEQLKREVRKAPRDGALRTFLFQLFCIVGEWDRAVTQLTVAGELDPLAVPMVQAYRATIRCEMLRARVFGGTRTPTIFGDPEPWMSLLVEANRVLASGRAAEAAKLRDDAFEQAPAAGGSIDGAPFAWIADADPRLGPMLEAVVEGKYYWVPFHRLAALDIEKPEDLRDQVWMPAHFVWTNGGEAFGFVPTRYPGSELQTDPALSLARRSEWQDHGEGWFTGLGQRMLATDAGEFALMDVRRIEIAAAAEAVL
jgi:type VI secretion system protein ImpE